MDYYQVLGVGREASPEEIRSAYRRAARTLHPDLHPGDPTREERLKELNQAYEVLSDPDRHREYDRELARREWRPAPLTRWDHEPVAADPFHVDLRRAPTVDARASQPPPDLRDELAALRRLLLRLFDLR